MFWYIPPKLRVFSGRSVPGGWAMKPFRENTIWIPYKKRLKKCICWNWRPIRSRETDGRIWKAEESAARLWLTRFRAFWTNELLSFIIWFAIPRISCRRVRIPFIRACFQNGPNSCFSHFFGSIINRVGDSIGNRNRALHVGNERSLLRICENLRWKIPKLRGKLIYILLNGV